MTEVVQLLGIRPIHMILKSTNMLVFAFCKVNYIFPMLLHSGGQAGSSVLDIANLSGLQFVLLKATCLLLLLGNVLFGYSVILVANCMCWLLMATKLQLNLLLW